MATFAERLKELREEKGISQQELGDEIGVSKDTVYRWEASKMQPKEEHVAFLAGFFHVSYLYLVGAVDNREMIIGEDDTDARAKEEEELMLKLYRSLSPDLKKMVQLTVRSAYLVERERRENRL